MIQGTDWSYTLGVLRGMIVRRLEEIKQVEEDLVDQDERRMLHEVLAATEWFVVQIYAEKE